MTGRPLKLHATAILVDEAGLLIRGPSGSGKSSLALALIGEAVRSGRFARFVADDAVLVEARSARLVARPHPRIAGKVERRRLGRVDVPPAPACGVRAIADIAGPAEPGPDRLPEPAALLASIAGVELPRVLLTATASLYQRMAVIFDVLAAFRAGS